MPSKLKGEEPDLTQSLHDLAVDVIAEVITDDSENEDKIREAVKDLVLEKLGDLDDAIREEVGDRIGELDIDELRDECVKEGAARVLEKLRAERA